MKKILQERYSELSLKGEVSIKRGNFKEALHLYSNAKAIALKLNDINLVHASIANLSLVLIELGEHKKAERGLREIIMSSTSEKIIFGASYSLAISLRKQGNYEKALKYANKAMQKAIAMDNTDYQARVHNLIGNIYLFQTYIDCAISEYMKALELRNAETSDNRFSMAILKENIGYCHILKREYKRGISYIMTALRLARSVQDQRCLCDCYQDLCYAYMLKKQLSISEKLGERALSLSIKNGYLDIEKNCYYLLGEINFLKGDPEKMDAYFQKLQEYYPNLPFLKDFLSKFDVSEIITLKQ